MTDPRLIQLRKLLEVREPYNDGEAEHLTAMLALLDRPGDHCSRSSFDPGHFTASGFVVSPDGSSLLLVHHHKLDKWLQPGGHIEPGDRDLEAAARREVREESGLVELTPTGLLDVDIHRFPQRGPEPAHQHLDVRFGFVAGSEEITPGEGTIEVRWYPLSEVAGWDDRPSMSRPAQKLLRS